MGRWYKLEGEAAGREVQTLVQQLETDQSARKANYLHNLRLFEAIGVGTADAAGYYRATRDAREDDRLGLVRSAIQTAAAEVFAKQKPKPQFQTSGAEWRIRRKAKKLDKICEGVLHQRQGRWLDVWDLVFDAGIECLIQGVAPIYVYADREGSRIGHELVPVRELFVDPAEGRNPQNLFRKSPIDVDLALARFADGDAESEIGKAILSAPQYDDSTITASSIGTPRAVKQVALFQAWRLPPNKKTPGKAVIVINNTVVAEEDWTAPSFPFVFVLWEPHRLGFWASGLVDEGGLLAERASEMSERLLNRARICGGRRTYIQRGSILNPEALEENDAEVIVEVEAGANMPVPEVVPPFTDADYQYAVSRVQAFWDAVGVSAVSAAARREPGVESAVAMRTLNDTKAGRQLPRAKMYEKIFVDLALQYVYRFRELAEEDPDFAVTWAGKNVLKEVTWSEADPGEDENFAVTVAPSSALPNDPAGRLSMAGELYASKLIDGPTYKQLLGWPDLEQELDSESAEYEYLDDLIDRYLDAEEDDWDAGDYESPEGAIVDKHRALLRFTRAMFTAKREKAPRFNLDLLRRYISELSGQISQAAAAQQAASTSAPGAPPPGASPGVPTAQPVPANMAAA